MNEDVKVIDLVITNVTTGTNVWCISTEKWTIWYKEKEGRLVLRDPHVLPDIHPIALSRLVIGEIPNGFIQINPLDDQAPIFEAVVHYVVSVVRGGHRGMKEFIVERAFN